MKKRLETNIDESLLKLLFLLDYAYFDHVALIFSCRNASEESSLGFTTFRYSQAKILLRRKIAKLHFFDRL